MTDARKEEAIALAERFMLGSMQGDREATDALMTLETRITFVGGRVLARPEEIKAVNAARYREVQKAIERYDVATEGDETVVYSIGTLYGTWADGEPFEGHRYVDRFTIRNGKIVRMDVWNDSAERLLERARLAKA